MENHNIRKWYTEQYPDDEMGQRIDPDATIEGMFEEMDNHRGVYAYIGVNDSIIRQRCFEYLSEISGMPYDEIYDQWLHNCKG